MLLMWCVLPAGVLLLRLRLCVAVRAVQCSLPAALWGAEAELGDPEAVVQLTGRLLGKQVVWEALHAVWAAAEGPLTPCSTCVVSCALEHSRVCKAQLCRGNALQHAMLSCA